MNFWRLKNNHVPRAKNIALFCFPLMVKRCARDEVHYRRQITHSNARMGQSTLTHQGWTINLVLSSKRKIVLEWKHALLPFHLAIAIMTTLITNKWSTRNSLLWQEVLMMFLSVSQSLNHGTFHGLKITNWFITYHGRCLLTGSNVSIKILLATVTFMLWI